MNVLGVDEVEKALKGSGGKVTLLNASPASQNAADANRMHALARTLESGRIRVVIVGLFGFSD